MTTEPNVSPPTEYRGSLLIGFLVGWAVLIVAYAVAFGLLAVFGSHSQTDAIVVGMPWICLLGLIVFFAVRNQPRNAVGVVLTIVSVFALGLLLVAACFGLFAFNAEHLH